VVSRGGLEEYGGLCEHCAAAVLEKRMEELEGLDLWRKEIETEDFSKKRECDDQEVRGESAGDLWETGKHSVDV
jgi:hypothetical protein